jgi:hypothetical protein
MAAKAGIAFAPSLDSPAAAGRTIAPSRSGQIASRGRVGDDASALPPHPWFIVIAHETVRRSLGVETWAEGAMSRPRLADTHRLDD